LAAMTPAILAVFRASPLGSAFSRSSCTVSGDILIRPAAVAVRRITAFPPTSTIRAAPSSSRCENCAT
jgi:hypothetical protein